MEIRTPEGSEYLVEDPQLIGYLRAKFPKVVGDNEIELAHGKFFDKSAVSIVGIDTIDTLSFENDKHLDKRRFRENFYIKWKNGQPFFEDSLVGKTIQIGDEARIQITAKDRRCKVITVDPITAEVSPGILKNLGIMHQGFAGVYGKVESPGRVAKGDNVYLIS